MDRRDFIKLTAVSGTSAALASCGNPENQLIRFVPDEDIVPGIAVWKPSVCPLCAAGCGLTVRVMDADAEVVRNGQAGVIQILAAKKLEGSPAHPVNRGRLCARGQAAIQVTYHPDRITQPLKRQGERGDGRYEAISWDAALTEVVARIDAVEEAASVEKAGVGKASVGKASTVRAVAFLTRLKGPHRDSFIGGHRGALISRFLAGLAAPGPITYELFGDDVLRRANALSFGREQLPTFDLPNARYVISFGADFLGTWNSPVSQGAGYGQMRQGRPGIRGAFVQVESRMSQTGANADEWVAVKPGTEGALALGMANVIISAKLRSADAGGRAGALVDGWRSGLPSYTPEQVEKLTGVATARIERLAHELAERGPAVAMIGGPPLGQTNGLFSAVAVNALNALLGSVERPGGVFFTPQFDVYSATKPGSGPPEAVPLERLAAGLLAGGATVPQVLLVDGANPVFTAPKAWRVREALSRVPYIVSFGSFLDETSVLADLILPDHSFLESWVEAVPESGSMMAVASVAPPVMKPLHDTRAMPDVLLEIARRLRRPLNLPWQTFEEMLTATFAVFPAPSAETDAWTDAQEKGGWWGTLPARLTVSSTRRAPAAPDTARALTFAEAQFDGDAKRYPFHFLPYPSSAFLDGALAHLPWLQEMPDPLTSAMWSSWVEINPATAARLDIGLGDLVEITSSQGMLRSAAVISPGIAPDVIAMPVGQGHQTFTRYASGRGENPVDLLAPMTEATTGAFAWAATRVRIEKVAGPDGRLILFAGGMREHDERGR